MPEHLATRSGGTSRRVVCPQACLVSGLGSHRSLCAFSCFPSFPLSFPSREKSLKLLSECFFCHKASFIAENAALVSFCFIYLINIEYVAL